jgi:hypothetical protein
MPHAAPDGWLAVHAANRDEARALAVALLGREWAFDYAPDEWGETWDLLYPAGPFHVITSETPKNATCLHCQHPITQVADTWMATDATGDDVIWRESCPDHDTFTAEHEPVPSDTEVIDTIARVMSGTEWSADTLDTIADCLRIAGRTILSDSDKPRTDIDCGHCVVPSDRCSDASDRNCMGR